MIANVVELYGSRVISESTPYTRTAEMSLTGARERAMQGFKMIRFCE